MRPNRTSPSISRPQQLTITHVKRLLRKYGYPPDMQEKATKLVLEQAEELYGDCVEAEA